MLSGKKSAVLKWTILVFLGFLIIQCDFYLICLISSRNLCENIGAFQRKRLTLASPPKCDSFCRDKDAFISLVRESLYKPISWSMWSGNKTCSNLTLLLSYRLLNVPELQQHPGALTPCLGWLHKIAKKYIVNPPILHLGNLGMERWIIFRWLCRESEGDETMNSQDSHVARKPPAGTTCVSHSVLLMVSPDPNLL